MNKDLQNLEIKVENDGTTPQGRLTATEWNILVAAVKSLDLTGGSADAASILQVVADAGYATQDWVTSQKYITSSAVDNLAKNLVTLDTTQAITGMKDFTNGLKIGGVSVYKSKEGIVFVDGNLAVRGAITMYADNGQAAPSIWDGFPYDDITIKRNAAGKFYAVGGGGTGGGISIADVENYLTGNGYITASALEPYALKTTIPTNTNQLTNDAGFITGITGTMVTTALGYTPYNSSNPAGYITSSGSITGNAATATKLATTRSIFGQNFDGSADVSGNIFPINANGCYYNENGISYHTNKLYQTAILRVTSSYNVAIGGTTASEKLHVYGNILATGTVSGAGGKFTDNVVIAEGKNIMMRSANAQYLSGMGYDTSGNECLALWAKNSVTRLRWSAGIDLSAGVNTGAMMGITPDFEISKATGVAIGYIAGNTILHSDNYSKYALPLTGGVVNGDVYSKNYRTDGVAYIQRLRIENLNEINGYSDYNGGSATGNAHINYASSGIVTLCNGGGNCAIGGATALDKLHVYGRGRFVMQGKSDQSSIVTEATALTISTNSAGHTSYNTGISFNALGDYSNLAYKNHIHAWIGLGGATTTLTSECYPLVFATNPNTSIAGTPVERMRITPDGNVAIGGETASEKLHVYGNILATGAITMYYTSDKRLKQNIRKVNASKMIMSLGGVYQYEYIDSEVAKNSTYGGSHYGLIYQNVKGTALSSMCHEREDGYGSLNYLDTNFLSLIAGATMENISEVEKLKKENKALKKRVEQLEKRVA